MEGSTTAPSVPADTRSRHAYRVGKIAFREQRDEDANPYPQGGKTSADRVAWYCGYFDARTMSKFGPLFRRHGVSFP